MCQWMPGGAAETLQCCWPSCSPDTGRHDSSASIELTSALCASLQELGKLQALSLAGEAARRACAQLPRDFQRMISALRTFLQELQKLQALGLAGEAAHRTRAQLLARELRALQAVDRLRACAAAEARAGAMERRLAALGALKRWPLRNAGRVWVDTPSAAQCGPGLWPGK